jgi:hypothetical protein
LIICGEISRSIKELSCIFIALFLLSEKLARIESVKSLKPLVEMSLPRNSIFVLGKRISSLSRFPNRIRCFTAHASWQQSSGSGIETPQSGVQPSQSSVPKEARPAYLTPIQEMLSLRGKVTVVTGKFFTPFFDKSSFDVQRLNFVGGARGIGLALAAVSAELGSDVAIIDTLEKPHEDFERLNDFGVKVKYYR